jgi:hypothetical protein
MVYILGFHFKNDIRAAFLFYRWLSYIFNFFFWNGSGTKENPGKLENNSLTIFRFISIFYLFFHLLWALNYYRKPLFEKWKLKKNTQILIYYYLQKNDCKTNAIQRQLTKSDSLKVVSLYPRTDFKMNLNGYDNLSKQHQNFRFKT